MSSKFNTSIYSHTLSWCSIHEPILVSEFFSQKNNFLSTYSKSHRKIAEIEIIHQAPYMNVTKERKIGIEEGIPDSLIRKIAERERLLFRIYKHFGIHYDLTLTRTRNLMAGSKDWNEQ